MRLSNIIFCGARRTAVTAVVEDLAGFKSVAAKRVGGGLLALLMSVSMVSSAEAQVAPGSSLGSSVARIAARARRARSGGQRSFDGGAKVAEKTSGEEAKKSPAVTGGVSEVEMARMVAALEERIRQLESRIESLTEAKSSAAG
jgi:TolA-binding protein